MESLGRREEKQEEEEEEEEEEVAAERNEEGGDQDRVVDCSAGSRKDNFGEPRAEGEEEEEEEEEEGGGGGQTCSDNERGDAGRTRNRQGGQQPQAQPQAQPQQKPESDPISESYRSIVGSINRVSNSFKEGKKWRCAADDKYGGKSGGKSGGGGGGGYFRSYSQISESSERRRRRRRRQLEKEAAAEELLLMTHSRTMEEALSKAAAAAGEEEGGGGGGGGGVEGDGRLSRNRGRRLVRQKATNEDGSGAAATLSPPSGSSVEVVDETAALLGNSGNSSKLLRVHARGGMPARQWTVDACTGLKESGGIGSNNGSGTAYLLRPVSRTSIVSGSSANNNNNSSSNVCGNVEGEIRRISPSDRSRSPRSPARERMRLGELTTRSAASSFNRSMDASVSSGGGEATGGSARALTAAERKDRRIYERALLPHLQAGHQRRARMQKQMTSESAPMAHGAAGGSAYQLPRQQSNASSSAMSYCAAPGGPGTGGGGGGGGSAAGSGGAAGSAGAAATSGASNLTTSFSHQGITLVRGASCSLVDIPTYLGPSVAATGGVELAQMPGGGIVAPTPAVAAAGAVAVAAPTSSRQASERRRKQGSISSGGGGGRRTQQRQRQQIDLTKKKQSTSGGGGGGGAAGASADSGAEGGRSGAGSRNAGGGGGSGSGSGGEKGSRVRKTQWTVLCVSLTLLTLAVTLVGGMLSVGSHYQEMVIARRWEELNRNKSDVDLIVGGGAGGGGGLMEPFVIVPIGDGEDEDEMVSGGGRNSTALSDFGGQADGGAVDEEGEVLPPIIFPELMAGSEEIRRLSELAKSRARRGRE